MKNKKQIVIATSVLVVTTILLLGLTYAYYKTRINGNTKDKSISVTSKKLEITYADGNGVIEGTGIEPGYTTTKTFTVENTGDETLSYSIKLDKITNTFSRTEDWMYVLKKGDAEVSSGVLPTNETYIVNVVSIDSKATNNYTLTITYANLTDVDQSLDMGKELSIRVNIDEAVGTIFESASEGTLLKAIGNDNLISKPLTTPGVEPSSTNETVLASTDDDYGNSYYFRGNVKNNFVNFSGMCWRIVRVQGDGSIKITLADESHECHSSDYSTSNYSGGINTEYIVFEYGYNSEYETSDVKKILEAWLNGGDYISDSGGESGTFEKKIDDTKLVETEWCNDMSISSKTYYDKDLNEIEDAKKAVYTDYYYGAYDRIAKTHQLTLKCNMTGLDDTKAIKVNSKIGVLTADEIAFAGESYNGKSSDRNYLKENTGSYWTMTPYLFSSRGGDYFIFSYDLRTYNSTYYGKDVIRPTLVLRSDVEITSGDGTQGNPYVVS